jgi:hypothetical protein
MNTYFDSETEQKQEAGKSRQGRDRNREEERGIGEGSFTACLQEGTKNDIGFTSPCRLDWSACGKRTT